MTEHERYVCRVLSGDYPETPRVPLGEEFRNDAGSIVNLLTGLGEAGNIAAIHTKRGAVRSNHYHRTDWHFLYVVSGAVIYYERGVGEDGIPAPHTFASGELFFTPPMREHAVVAASDCLMISVSRNPRDHENHENDVVRVRFVEPGGSPLMEG